MVSAGRMEAAKGGGGGGVGKKRRRAKSDKLNVDKYQRGEVRTKSIADRKLRGRTTRDEALNRDAAIHAAKAEVLQPYEAGHLEAEGMERTYKFKQEEIRENVDRASARKIFDITLDYGPYHMRYSRNGRHLLLGGQKGHVALMDWQAGKVTAELQLRESVRDVSFLHNETLFAVAQKKYAYIYDNKGIEVHCLKHHRDPLRLEFLPYHFLLASIGNAGNERPKNTRWLFCCLPRSRLNEGRAHGSVQDFSNTRTCPPAIWSLSCGLARVDARVCGRTRTTPSSTSGTATARSLYGHPPHPSRWCPSLPIAAR